MVSRKRFLGALAAGSLMYPGFSVARSDNEPYFPNSILHTHDGKAVRFYDDLVKGRLVVFNMMYTACTNICPPTTANLLQVQQALGERVGRDVFFYSITLQPELDSPAALQDYVRKFNIKPGWTFLTGKRKDIDTIRRKLGFYDLDPEVDADMREHTGMLRIGHDALNRWSMSPAIGTTRQVVKSISDYL